MPARARTAFFDSSAIVLLCMAQASSQDARKAYRQYKKQVVAWTTIIECAGAIYRGHRSGAFSESNALSGIQRLTSLRHRWLEVVATERIQVIAQDLLKVYDLRAADSIQLASALQWCKEKPKNRIFVSYDQRLADAAHTAGFNVIR